MQERLQKIISRAGVASRRAGEDLILAGRVRVNGRIVTELGAKADLYEDEIEVDGKRLMHEPFRYLILHKPRKVVSTLSDPEGRPTIADLLRNAGARLYPVGRLDFATSGVLLITNDGDFANGLLHPRGGVPKTYVVKVMGTMEERDFERWATGVRLEDGVTLPAEVRFLRHEEGKTWFEITLREGRNQQIRRMGEATGFTVMRLARLSFAGITSEGLRPGEWRPLSVDELMDLRKTYGVPKRVKGAVMAQPQESHDRRAPRTHERPKRPVPSTQRERRGSADERPRGERGPAGAPTRGRARDERPSRGRAGEAEPRARAPRNAPPVPPRRREAATKEERGSGPRNSAPVKQRRRSPGRPKGD